MMQSGYFPKEADMDRSMDQWYSQFLAQFQERPIKEYDSHNRVYRFLWLRSFHHPICIRVFFNHSGDGGVISAKELDGGDVYGAPIGQKIKDQQWSLSGPQAKALQKQIEAAGFWTLPVYDNGTAPLHAIRKTGQGFPVCFDGAQWVLEGWQNGKYHMARRWSPADGPVRNLGVTLLKCVDLYPPSPHTVY